MTIRSTKHPILRRLLIALFFLQIPLVAISDELQDIKKLMKDHNLAEALISANKVLARQPNDASMQFLKGLILSEQKKTDEAIEVFSKLTTDHPDFPEPYNNLAVLFASSGFYSKARISLDTALKLNPKYATARENLGDVYLQSALQEYAEGIKIDTNNILLKAKLKDVRIALGINPDESTAKSQSSLGISVASIPSQTPKTNFVLGGIQGNIQTDRDIVLRTVEQWASAWSAKDTNAYFSFYAEQFHTPSGESRTYWKRHRLSRIKSKGRIGIQILSPSVTVENDSATVNFQQVYVSGKINSNDRKQLILIKQGGAWRILQENSV